MRRHNPPFLVASVSLALCVSCPMFARVQQDFHESHPMPSGGRLSVVNQNGSIDVVGWDRDSIDVAGTKYAGDDDLLKQIEVTVKVSGASASIESHIPRSFWQGSAGVKLVIRVPVRIRLESVSSTNGGANIENITGGGSVRSTNGALAFSHAQGDFEAETTNGAITMQECSGNERAHTTNGPIRVRLSTGAVEAQSTNGGVEVAIDHPSQDRHLKAETTNGSVSVSLAEFRANPISVQTTNGAVKLKLPDSTSADLDLHTNTGGIHSDLNLTSNVQWSKNNLTGRLGGGGPTINASTNTGRIDIERY